MEDKRVLKREGRSLTIDKEILDDQKVLEVGTNLPTNAKLDKDDKATYEDYKILYKGAIDEKCLATYGTCDDTKLWEDIAKEMFLKSKSYIPSEDDKPDDELNKKIESRTVIKHNKIIENKVYKVKINTPFGEMSFDQEADSKENANKTVLDKVKSAFKPDYQDKVSLVENKSDEQYSLDDYKDFLKLGNDYYAAFEMADFSKDTLIAKSMQDIINHLTDIQKEFINWLVEVSVYGDSKLEGIQQFLGYDDTINTFANGYIQYYQDKVKNPNLFDYFVNFIYNYIGENYIGLDSQPDYFNGDLEENKKVETNDITFPLTAEQEKMYFDSKRYDTNGTIYDVFKIGSKYFDILGNELKDLDKDKKIESMFKYDELKHYKDYYIASAFLDLLSNNEISDEIGDLILSKMKEYGYEPIKEAKECPKQD